MAQNAYSTTSVNYSSTVGKDKSKRVRYKDEGDDGDQIRSGKHPRKDDEEEYTFYPAFCFPASPTHFTWVKMCIADIHRLQARKGFEGQNIYFYKNYPIQFVCLAGYIVSREEYERRTVLMLDDSSGALIEIIALKAPVKEVQDGGNNEGSTTVTTVATTTTATAMEMEMEMTNVTSTTRTPIDITQMRIGTAIKIKGTIATYRFRMTSTPIMQVILERFWILRDTNEEIKFWNERSRFLVDVLSEPWCLTKDEIESLRRQTQDEERRVIKERQRNKERKKKHEEREGKYQRRILRRWEAEEKLRLKECDRINEDNRKLERWLVSKRQPSEDHE